MPRRDNRIEFRALPEMETEIDQRVGRLNRGLVAQRDLERYYTALTRELRSVHLTAPEASLICDASNGTLWEPHSVLLLWAEVDDSLADGLAEKWGVDGPALVAKLRALTYSQALAVCDGAERFWARQADDQDHATALRAVGLIR